jgi:hypothetical protein
MNPTNCQIVGKALEYKETHEPLRTRTVLLILTAQNLDLQWTVMELRPQEVGDRPGLQI